MGSEESEALGEIRRRQARLEVRVLAQERRYFSSVAFLGLAMGVLAPFLPFLMPTSRAPEQAESVSLFAAIVVLPDAGSGPFREAAMLTGVAVIAYLAALFTMLVTLVTLWVAPSAKKAMVARYMTNVLLGATLCAALMNFVLAAHFEGTVSLFSPAVFAVAICALLAHFASRIHPDVV